MSHLQAFRDVWVRGLLINGEGSLLWELLGLSETIHIVYGNAMPYFCLVQGIYSSGIEASDDIGIG